MIHGLRILIIVLLSINGICAQTTGTTFDSEDPAQKQREIDSLVSIGENMFSASNPLVFKEENDIESTSKLINPADLVIILDKAGPYSYKVEWDNQEGYIFQYDLEPFDILSSDLLINKPDDVVKYDSGETINETIENIALTEHAKTTEDKASLSNRCEIQFFASKYNNKKFNALSDLGKVVGTTILSDKITRYRIIADADNDTCESLILELENRGFPGSFKVN